MIVWDDAGKKVFEAGVDRGVLYLSDGAVPWNGLLGVEEDVSGKGVTSFYIDGVKYLDSLTAVDTTAKIKAYTYPDEFLRCEGVVAAETGLYVDSQPPEQFCLSYRTKVGNDEDGIDHGYKIHLLYDLVVVPDNRSYETIGETVDPMEFSWSVYGLPQVVPGRRPTAHAVIDSRDLLPGLLSDIETILYGSVYSDPDIPTIQELITIIAEWVPSVGQFDIVDLGNGTYTVSGPDQLISVSGGVYTISDIDGAYSDADHYTIND